MNFNKSVHIRRVTLSSSAVISLLLPAVCFAQAAPSSGPVPVAPAATAATPVGVTAAVATPASAPGAAPAGTLTAENPVAPATEPAPGEASLATAPAEPAPATVEPEAAAAPATAEADAKELDLDALLSSDTDQAEVDPYSLNLYGFADFSYVRLISDTVSTNSGFSVGNVNLYLDAELGPGWRALTEVRFTYLPHGSVPSGSFGVARTNTSVGDYTELGRPMKVGGIELERAWVEYKFNNWFTLRGGSWLTPYGIWNVDHGSPAIIGTIRPYIIGEELFPERQSGLMLFGSTQVGPAELGYYLTASNGRGPFDTYDDLDKRLAFGGRLYATIDGSFGQLGLGVSGYTGRYTDSNVTNDPPTFAAVTHITNQYDETSLAVDLKYQLGGLLFQSELIVNTLGYTDAGRPAALVFDGSKPGLTPDQKKVGAYGILGYRLPWLNTMPWLGAEYYDGGVSSFFGTAAATFLGLNVRPHPRAVLKFQHIHAWFPDTQKFSKGSDFLIGQVAWSF